MSCSVLGVQENAAQLLRSLIGCDISTVTGRPNRVMTVQGDQVVVATSRSPKGRTVPIHEVQTALDRLLRDRAIEISVASVGYRSAFIGAVLSELPGAHVDRSKSPPWIRLAPTR
jgi:hypothetical protein